MTEGPTERPLGRHLLTALDSGASEDVIDAVRRNEIVWEP
jgi:hypothetical protein